MIPAKADPVVQAAYLNEVLEPRLDEARSGKRAVFFVDAAHFVLAPFLGFLWSVSRLFIKAVTRRRVRVSSLQLQGIIGEVQGSLMP